MDFESSAFDTLLERTREIATTITGPNADDVDQNARWPEESLEALLDAGLGGLVVPAEAGGHNRGLKAVARVCEELGKHCGSTGLCYGMHCVGTACLAARATPRQKEKWLEPIAAGEHLTTLALSEPGTGVHLYLPQTELLDADGHYLVNGTKSFVTNGRHADSYVASTVAAREASTPGEFSCVAIPADADGLKWQDPWRGVGMRGNAASTVDLQDVKVPHENLLGAEGDQIWYVFRVVIPYFLNAMAGTYLGIATGALEEAVDHLKERSYSFGGTDPANSSVIQREVGSLWRRLESARQLIYAGADAGETRSSNSLITMFSAKADIARCCVDVINGAMTLIGGRGYAENSTMSRHLRDARAADVMAPTTQMLETWIGRELLDLPLFPEQS